MSLRQWISGVLQPEQYEYEWQRKTKPGASIQTYAWYQTQVLGRTADPETYELLWIVSRGYCYPPLIRGHHSYNLDNLPKNWYMIMGV